MNRISGVVVLCLGSYILYQGRHLSFGSLRAPGPGFFPAMIAIALMIVSLFLIIPRREEKDEGQSFSVRFTSGIMVAVVALLGFFFFLEYLGFVITAFLLMVLLFKTISSMKWYTAALWSFISVGLTYLTFGVLLKIPLPQGVLGFLGF